MQDPQLDEFNENRNALIRHYSKYQKRGRRNELTCLGVQYPPFCQKNGKYSGLFYEILNYIAKDLKTDLVITEDVMPWNKNEEALQGKTTMAAPAFARGFRGHEVVSFLCFYSGIIVYRREEDKNDNCVRKHDEIQKALLKIHRRCDNLRSPDAPIHETIDPLGSVIDGLKGDISELAVLSNGKLGVCRGFIEETVLSEVFSRGGLSSYEERDPLDSLKKGIEDGRIFITDSVIWNRFNIEYKEIACKCVDEYLFGIPIPIIAGIPILRFPALRNYILFAVRTQTHPVHKLIIDWVDRQAKENESVIGQKNHIGMLVGVDLFLDKPKVIRGFDFASLDYWLSPGSFVPRLAPEFAAQVLYGYKFRELSSAKHKRFLIDGQGQESAKFLAHDSNSLTPWQVKNTLLGILRYDEMGLALFLQLAGERYLDFRTVSEDLGPTSALFFITSLVENRMAVIKGRVLFVTESGIHLANHLKEGTSDGDE